jgi:predicted enzyme related to lactoylglutathione lyase
MARVTGVGGVFLKAKDPKALYAWYEQHLGMKIHPGAGAIMMWSDEIPAGTGMTVWSLFAEDSAKFGTGPQRAMINYRVDDLDALLTNLAAAGVEIDPKREEDPYGKFGWIVDPEGNRIELWQPLA